MDEAGSLTFIEGHATDTAQDWTVRLATQPT